MGREKVHAFLPLLGERYLRCLKAFLSCLISFQPSGVLSILQIKSIISAWLLFVLKMKRCLIVLLSVSVSARALK
ncbi:hypothetical protein BHQ29_09115 [Pseudomonas sp. LPH1]|nr:hypothetical protein BHQ29_09115 [Pseudomonas sp. LPH1]